MPSQFVRFRPFAIVAAGLVIAGPVSGQFAPGGANLPPAGSQAMSRGLSGSAPQGVPSSFSVSPYYGGWGGGGENTQQIATPWSSQHGSWIQAPTSYWTQNTIASQQATISQKMSYQDLEQRKLQLKRAAFDEMRYEKMNTPPIEVQREEARMDRLAVARNLPPREQIASGDTLNVLLNDIALIQTRGNVKGPVIPLDPETVRNLNISTTDNSSGSNEFFKPGGFPEWPFAFSSDSFNDDKKRMEADLNAMAKAQFNGKIDRAKVDSARRTVEAIKAKLFTIRTKVAFNDYVSALEFCSKLGNTIETLAKPGAKNFLDGAYAAKGDTVEQLVTYMISKGLKFCQATPGMEPNYYTFYQHLVTYDISVSRMMGSQPQSQSSMQWPPQR
jgi:hypothetical protein